MAESTAAPVLANTAPTNTALADTGPADTGSAGTVPAEPVPADTGPGEQQILPLIDHLARVGRRAAEMSMSGWMRPRHMIALQLLREHGPMTQHALGTALCLDPSNVVGLLNELEERALITRRRDPADRRRHIVDLSEAGTGELTRGYRRLGQVEDELFKSLTAEERATLHTLLVRASDGLASDSPCQAAPCAVPVGLGAAQDEC